MSAATERFVATSNLRIKVWPDETTVAVFAPDGNARTHLISDLAGQLLQRATAEAVSLEELINFTLGSEARLSSDSLPADPGDGPKHAHNSETAEVELAVESAVQGLVQIGLMRLA
jgi:hypothetical protein